MPPGFGMTVSIDGPSPSAPALTLVGAARAVPSTDDRWMNGARVWPYPRDLPDTFDPCQDDRSSGHAKAAGSLLASEEFGAFTVLEGITCTTGSVQSDVAEWKRRATVALEAYEHWGIEHEFWTGALKPDNPHLAQAGAGTPLATQLLNSGAATNTRHGIALLEQAIADKGGNGVIHMRPLVFSQMNQDAPGHVEVANGVARTLLGTTIVPGVGYPGTKQDGSAPAATHEWAYATGPIEIRKSEVVIVPGSISEATDRESNVTTFRAERHVLITWDQRIHAVVQIDRAFVTFTT